MNEVELNNFPVIKKRVTRYNAGELLFYRGSMPLTYDLYMKSLSEHSIPNGHYIVLMKFEDFHSVFSYSDNDMRQIGIAKSAQTYDDSKRLLARATMLKWDMEHVEIEEVHYDRAGQLQFRCKSDISPDGEKLRERETHGEKVRDYYFLWPAGCM